MKNLLNSIAVLALMAGPALAQDQADLDAFGITDDGATLDQLAPDDGSTPPALPAPAQEAPAAEPPAAEPSVAEPSAVTEVPLFEAPADWVVARFRDYAFRHPDGWSVMQEEPDGLYLFNGDRATEQGGVFAIALDRQENLMPPGAEITSEIAVTLAGQPFRRLELIAQFDATHKAEMILLVSDQPMDGQDHLLIVGMSMGKPLDDYREAIGQIIGTIRYEPAPPEQETALDGLVVYAVPEGWQTLTNADGMTIYPAEYSGSIAVLKGAVIDGPGGFLEDVPSGAGGTATLALGNPATVYSWPGTEPEYIQGNTQVPGEVTLFLLDECAPDGDRLAVVVAGVPEATKAEAFKAALAGIALSEGTGLVACAPREAVPSATADPASPSGAPEASAAPAPDAATSTAPALPLQVVVGGVTYLLPEGWQANYDSPDDQMWASPDGRFTVLSFWWFPDEPLLGYEGIESVDNVIIDHEPVTRITSVTGPLRTIQNVTERARSDKKRFIFTLEGSGVDPAELQTLHDQLAKTLRYGAGFDPTKPVGFAQVGPAPIAVPVVTAPASEAAPSGPGFTVNFAEGLQGWAGDFATLSILPDGGPDGRGVLEAFTPGDGTNGYLSARPELLFDWTGTKGLSVTIRSQPGTYVAPYDFGGRGDIYIASRGKNASISFPRRVTEDWQTMTVSFDDPGWKLDGGAKSVADVLTFVTSLKIRVEFIEGDARAWVSSVSLLSGNGADQAAAAAAATGWTQYVNARFGTSIDYDTGLFLPQPAPENGDGQTFLSTDALGWFVVFGQQNYDGLDARAMMVRDRDMAGYDEVSYETSGKNWYVLSGYDGGDIFYRKALIDRAAGTVHVFEITYPPAQRDIYDPMTVRMAKSLTDG